MRRIDDLSASLYDALVRPVRGTIAEAERIVIVPPDPLIPFHALRVSRRKSERYLIQRSTVLYLPSAAFLLLPSSQPAQRLGIVGFGHAGTTQWDVEYELRDIRAFAKDARLFFGTEAVLAKLQNERASIFHLAVEFHYDGRAQGNSYLLLSDGISQSTTKSYSWGVLASLPTVEGLILSDLGVHTGIPPAKPSLLLMRGTRATVMTAYPAHRKTKKYFGELFYTSYLTGNAPQESYRMALVGMIENAEYEAPYIWAPFFLWGR
jgi:CHAT domain-containing protein